MLGTVHIVPLFCMGRDGKKCNQGIGEYQLVFSVLIYFDSGIQKVDTGVTNFMCEFNRWKEIIEVGNSFKLSSLCVHHEDVINKSKPY